LRSWSLRDQQVKNKVVELLIPYEISMDAITLLLNSKYSEYGKLYYAHWFNELYEFKKWLQEIILLQAFFKKHNKKYLMLNTAKNNLRSWLQPESSFIEAVRPLISFFDL
jgi:hypothetical protein